jgi:hypothetical protein
MSTFVARSRAVVVALILSALPLLNPGHAQQGAREDNIWGGKDHQPTQSDVLKQERLHGLASSAKQDRAEDEQVERLYQSLIGSRSGVRS